MVEELLGWAVVVDVLKGQQGQEAFLEGTKAALDFAFGLGTWSDEMSDPQGGERPLELRAGIAAIGRGLIAEKGQAVGVEGHRTAVSEEGAAEVLEMMPGGIGRDKSGPEVFAGMVVDGEEQGLLVLCRPPGMDGRVVLPEFANPGALPAPFGFGDRKWLQDEIGELGTGIGSDGLAIPVEGEAGDELVGDQLEIRWALERQEALQEASNFRGPTLVVIAAGDVQGEA